MKAVTIWQPWASLIIVGAKPYEFRGWAAPKSICGKRIAIHAGARPIKRIEVSDLLRRLTTDNESWSTALHPDIALPLLERALTTPRALPLSSIVGTAVLGTPRRATEIIHEFGGPASDSDRHAHSNWAWPLLDIEPLLPPVERRGAQGFWDVNL